MEIGVVLTRSSRCGRGGVGSGKGGLDIMSLAYFLETEMDMQIVLT